MHGSGNGIGISKSSTPTTKLVGDFTHAKTSVLSVENASRDRPKAHCRHRHTSQLNHGDLRIVLLKIRLGSSAF